MYLTRDQPLKYVRHIHFPSNARREIKDTELRRLQIFPNRGSLDVDTRSDRKTFLDPERTRSESFDRIIEIFTVIQSSKVFFIMSKSLTQSCISSNSWISSTTSLKNIIYFHTWNWRLHSVKMRIIIYLIRWRKWRWEYDILINWFVIWTFFSMTSLRLPISRDIVYCTSRKSYSDTMTSRRFDTTPKRSTDSGFFQNKTCPDE